MSIDSNVQAIAQERGLDLNSAVDRMQAKKINELRQENSQDVQVISGNNGRNVQSVLDGGSGANQANTRALEDRINEDGLQSVIDQSAAVNGLSDSQVEVLQEFKRDIDAGNDAYDNDKTDKVAILVDNSGLIREVTTHEEIYSQLDGVSNSDLGGSPEHDTIAGEQVFVDNQYFDVTSNHFWSPLAMDTDGDGVETSDETVRYDINGDGSKEKINNVDDAILAINGGDDGSELFGNNTDLGMGNDYNNGFEALRALAEKEGLIGPDDNALDEADIKHLEEKYGFGVKTDGYGSNVQSLLDQGITQINLGQSGATEWNSNFDGQGNALQTQAGATFETEDGEVNDYADVWHTGQ